MSEPRSTYDNEHNIPFVRCYRCGEMCETAWKLLGATAPDAVTDYLCSACEDEEAHEPDDDENWLDDCHMDASGYCGKAGSEECDECPIWDMREYMRKVKEGRSPSGA